MEENWRRISDNSLAQPIIWSRIYMGKGLISAKNLLHNTGLVPGCQLGNLNILGFLHVYGKWRVYDTTKGQYILAISIDVLRGYGCWI